MRRQCAGAIKQMDLCEVPDNTAHPKALNPWQASLLALVSGSLLAAPPQVLEPAAPFLRVPAGYDFATQELGDPWDMDRIEDTFTPNSAGIVNQVVTGGIYSFDTVEDGDSGLSKAQVWLIHPGLKNAQRLVSEDRNPLTGRRLFTREKFPIDPAVYRYLTARVRMSSATAEPLQGNQRLIVFYFEDSTSIGDAAIGASSAFPVPPDEWVIVRLDLATEVDPNYPESWSLLPQVEGLRIDPTPLPGVHVEIDWIRLTAEPEPEEVFTVRWTGNGAKAYSVAARPASIEGVAGFELASGVKGSSVQVELSALPPGEYLIEVDGDGEIGVSPGTVKVNDVPLISFSAPNIKGDQGREYGAIVTSNPWSEIDAADIAEILDFESYSFSKPVGSLTGRPTGSTSRLLFATPVAIDTAYYRMLCFEAKIEGERDIGTGSVHRLLWGNKRSTLTTTSPVIAQEGLNEYCVGDVAELRIDPLSPPQAENAWAGPIANIRFDPHEFPRALECNANPSPEACRDVRFDSFVLAPFHSTNPDFTFAWSDSDADDDAVLEIWLDDDRVPGNTPGSMEHLVGSARENDALDRLTWTPPDEVPDGTWQVYGLIDDGRNRSVRYAGGPLLIGAPPFARLRVLEPDGLADDVAAGTEYGLDQRRNQWDMDEAELNLSLARNITGASLSGGMFSGTTSSTGSQFILMTSNEGDPEIVPANYRYLTVKMRVSGADGPHFVQLFFSADPKFDPPTAGFTEGLPIDRDTWSLLTFDLLADIHGDSPTDWASLPAVRSLRVDPTNQAGTLFEIDWITLSPSPLPATDYTVRWSADNMGSSTYDVDLVDSLGQRFVLAAGLPATTREFTTNLSRLITGSWYFEVRAVPGPGTLSPGPVKLLPGGPDASLLLDDGFE